MSEKTIYILCIETANAVTSVAVAKNKERLHIKEVSESNKAADTLHVLIEMLLHEASLSFSDLHAVAISAGPGSYTGLRIAASAAKGYCFALNIPLLAIPTLEAMVQGMQKRYQQHDFDIYVPMIDARRMEVYTSFYKRNIEIEKQFSSLIVDEQFANLCNDKKKYLLFGNGAQKAEPTINVDTTVVYKEFVPSSEDLILLAYSRYEAKQTENIVYFEPNYTKQVYTKK